MDMPAWDRVVLLQAVLFAGSMVDVVVVSTRVDNAVRFLLMRPPEGTSTTYIGAWGVCGCADSSRHWRPWVLTHTAVSSGNVGTERTLCCRSYISFCLCFISLSFSGKP